MGSWRRGRKRATVTRRGSLDRHEQLRACHARDRRPDSSAASGIQTSTTRCPGLRPIPGPSPDIRLARVGDSQSRCGRPSESAQDARCLEMPPSPAPSNMRQVRAQKAKDNARCARSEMDLGRRNRHQTPARKNVSRINHSPDSPRVDGPRAIATNNLSAPPSASLPRVRWAARRRSTPACRRPCS